MTEEEKLLQQAADDKKKADEENKLISSKAAIQRKKLESKLTAENPWNYSALGKEAAKAAMAMVSIKHGIYAKVPLVCKGKNCPYAFQCELLQYELAPTGEKCPIETARMAQEYKGFSSEFNLDESSQTDKTLVSEIISMNILLERCQMLMAKEATPVVDVVAGVTEEGEEIIQPAVSKAVEAFQTLVKRRNENLQLMMATRKDKKEIQNNSKTTFDIIAETISKDDFETVEQKPEDLE